MNPIFNLPSVDHLVEGVHYRLVDYNFAERQAFAIGYPQQQYGEEENLRNQQTNMPSRGMPSTFAEECGPDEKMVFGMCRKTKGQGGGEKDFDSSKKTKQEEEGEAEAKKQGSDAKNNKMIKDVKSGKKLGWAVKDGKPVLVEWGSVAGEAKVGAKKPKDQPKPPQGASRSGVTDAQRQGQRQGNDSARARQVTAAGVEAQGDNRRRIEAQTRSS
jgi:hypothetical protein